MSAIKRVLVPIDFSPASTIAFQYAVDLASRQGATVHLLHVVDEARLGMATPEGFYADVPGLGASLIKEALARLGRLVSTSGALDPAPTTEVLVGRPVEEIARTATARGTDLIVMGTHGRSGVAHLILGSVTERVLRVAPCAVLTVRDTSRIADTIAADAVTQRQAAAKAPAVG
jgi:universal stress protein A